MEGISTSFENFEYRRVILIKNRLIDQVWCLDQNTDSLELIETICFNTIVLDLRAENDNCVTHVIINQKWLRSSLRASENGLREVTMKIIEKRLPIKNKLLNSSCSIFNWFDDTKSQTEF